MSEMNRLLAERAKASKNRFNKGAHGGKGKKWGMIDLYKLHKEEFGIPFLIAGNSSVGTLRGYYPYAVHYVPMKSKAELEDWALEKGISFEDAEKSNKIPVLCQRGPLGKNWKTTPCAICDAKVAAAEAGWFDEGYEPDEQEQEALDALEYLGVDICGSAQCAIFAYAEMQNPDDKKSGLVMSDKISCWQLGLKMWNSYYGNPDYRSREIIRTLIELQKEDRTIFVPDQAEPENWKWVELYEYQVGKESKKRIGLRVCKKQYDIPAEVFETCEKSLPAFHTWKTKDNDKGEYKTKSAVVAYDTQLKLIARSFWGKTLKLDITKGSAQGCPLEPYLED